jgi:hypothetical protein
MALRPPQRQAGRLLRDREAAGLVSLSPAGVDLSRSSDGDGMDIAITGLIVRATARADAPGGLPLPWESPWWSAVADGRHVAGNAAARTDRFWLVASDQ